MGFKCGIVGLPNVGKSTVFNSLSNAKAEAANYPFCTIEPNVGMIPVKDLRLDALSEIVQPQKVLPTVVKIVDIAGLVRGASKGEGLGNQFLGNIRECEAIIHVLRCFKDPNVIHVEGDVDPIRDKEIIETELLLADLDALQKRLDKSKKQTKGGDKKAIIEVEVLERVVAHVETMQPVRSLDLNDVEEECLSGMGLLSQKPVLYCCNVDEAGLPDGNEYVELVKEATKDEDAELMVLCAAFESDLSELDDEGDKKEFLESVGLNESGLDILVRKSYSLLDLETYFTAGVKEVRAWTIVKGTKAPQAAGVIHTDFEKGFIRAEVIKYDDYIQYKSEAAVKEVGKMGVEGKEYVVEDGDIMHFRFNV